MAAYSISPSLIRSETIDNCIHHEIRLIQQRLQLTTRNRPASAARIFNWLDGFCPAGWRIELIFRPIGRFNSGLSRRFLSPIGADPKTEPEHEHGNPRNTQA